MKTLNLIFIATALLLATACTDTEKVLPYDAASALSFDQHDQAGDVVAPSNGIRPSDISVNQAPHVDANYTNKTATNCQNCGDDARQPENKYFGELLPASFLDCGIFIRLTEDQLFEVTNAHIIRDTYLQKGGPVAFSFVTSEDLASSCGVGIAIELTSISFLPGDGQGNDKANGKGSGKN